MSLHLYWKCFTDFFHQVTIGWEHPTAQFKIPAIKTRIETERQSYTWSKRASCSLEILRIKKGKAETINKVQDSITAIEEFFPLYVVLDTAPTETLLCKTHKTNALQLLWGRNLVKERKNILPMELLVDVIFSVQVEIETVIWHFHTQVIYFSNR